MQQHPEHYSLPMRLLGSDAVAWMQEKGLGAGVWFNVEVEVAGKVRMASCTVSSCSSAPTRRGEAATEADDLHLPLCRSSSTVPSPSMRSAGTCLIGRRSTSLVALRNP
jgi:hypothetical protein